VAVAQALGDGLFRPRPGALIVVDLRQTLAEP
jgi:hypothetical protein